MTTTAAASYATTEVAESKSDSWSTAPNGSSRSHDFYTTVVSRQVWADIPENGIYAGRVYRIVEHYISGSPDRRGQQMDRSSQPWTDEG